jgi:hypothetical protein
MLVEMSAMLTAAHRTPGSLHTAIWVLICVSLLWSPTATESPEPESMPAMGRGTTVSGKLASTNGLQFVDERSRAIWLTAIGRLPFALDTWVDVTTESTELEMATASPPCARLE